MKCHDSLILKIIFDFKSVKNFSRHRSFKIFFKTVTGKKFLFFLLLDAPYSRIESDRLFDGSGRLIPSSTVLGRGVCVGDEEVVRNCIVMPSKNINYSIKNQIVL